MCEIVVQNPWQLNMLRGNTAIHKYLSNVLLGIYPIIPLAILNWTHKTTNAELRYTSTFFFTIKQFIGWLKGGGKIPLATIQFHPRVWYVLICDIERDLGLEFSLKCNKMSNLLIGGGCPTLMQRRITKLMCHSYAVPHGR